MSFRRDFDAEIVTNARGRPHTHQPAPITPTTLEALATRFIVVAAHPKLLNRLLALHCTIKPRGQDWHIETRSQANLDTVLNLLKRNNIHGLLRRQPRPGPYSGRREPLAP